jgi:hypothetical protein
MVGIKVILERGNIMINIVEVDYENRKKNGVEFSVEWWLEREGLIKDDGKLYCLEKDKEKLDELYERFKYWVDSGDCFDGFDE